MCLLITQPEGVVFDENFLQGVYNYNSDGIGMMYAEDTTLYSAKYVPKTFKDYLAFYREHIEGRACVWHSRLQTHGPVQISNSHPFEVLTEEDGYPLYLAHNGILATGNKEDPSKTDTELFIKNFLRPMLRNNPEYFMDPSFAELIGDYIGTGNKFVLLDAYGNQVTVNESQFVDYNGAKLSNTYAWDTTGTEHDYIPAWKGAYARGYSSYSYPLSRQSSKNLTPNYKGDDLNDDYVMGPNDVSAYDENSEDMADFCEETFAELHSAGMTDAYNTLSFNDLQGFYKREGSKMAWDASNLIQYSAYDDREFIELIRGVPMAVEPTTHEAAK